MARSAGRDARGAVRSAGLGAHGEVRGVRLSESGEVLSAVRGSLRSERPGAASARRAAAGGTRVQTRVCFPAG